MNDTGHKAASARRLGNVLGAGFAAMTFGLLVTACDDNRNDSADANRNRGAAEVPAVPPNQLPQQAEKRDTPSPPPASPGAAPSPPRVIGAWTVFEAKDGAAGDMAAGTTYRFEDAGKVTVAGAKQCAYIIEASLLKVDCGGALSTGKVEFRDAETMVWTIAEDERVTLKKR